MRENNEREQNKKIPILRARAPYNVLAESWLGRSARKRHKEIFISQLSGVYLDCVFVEVWFKPYKLQIDFNIKLYPIQVSFMLTKDSQMRFWSLEDLTEEEKKELEGKQEMNKTYCLEAMARQYIEKELKSEKIEVPFWE